MTRTERVARAIANAMDVDPDVFIGMHGRAKWEKQWLPIATAALTAIDEERDALREALTAFADEYLPSGIRETPEWQAVLNQARSLSSVSREEN